MQKHTKIYYKHFDYFGDEFIACEICNSKAIDVHHLESKGMGGSKTKDYIENLIAVCRTCHVKCHSNKEFNQKAKEIHLKNL